ncbi:glycoside hydrolase family 3 protein [Desulfurispira natronophila]|uniref:Beta-N-acetylhexosaminidase n=1 Tax=Desulfurispira natronophila TaxID=682562 RepID=A0A7W7Y3T7_9BACT|nr:glycoside hydrolase family 3 protein [Desulfurispira natronophila]MBB5021514.1 beta-N-acetylhexosaminidase [Desulfurispira natronophila]
MKKPTRFTFVPALLILAYALFIISPVFASSQDQPSIEVMVGQMLMVGFRGQSINDASAIAVDIRERHIGGIILFDRDVLTGSHERNISSTSQVRTLTTQLQSLTPTPLFIAVDQEGGRVARLKEAHGFTASLPSHQQLGRDDDLERTGEQAHRTALELARLGINVNFAPVLDVDTNRGNPVIGGLQRSFSSDPRQVARHGIAFADAMSAAGVIPAYKHFPGHGSSHHDSHLGFTDISTTWHEDELIPFQTGVQQAAGPVMVMTGHLFHQELDPEYPATLSPAVLNGLLREQIGFDGVIVSDDMQMKAISEHYGLEEALQRSIEAGVDIILFGNNLEYEPDIARRAHDMILDMVTEGHISLERIQKSYKRIMKLKAWLDQQ